MQSDKKAVLTSEVEDAFFKGSRDQHISTQVATEQVWKLSQWVYDNAIIHGVDPRLLLPGEGENKTTIKAKAASSTPDDPGLEEQFGVLLSFLSTSSSDFNFGDGGDAAEFTSRSILTNIRLPGKTFEPLLDSLRVGNAILHRTLLSQPLVSGNGSPGKVGRGKEKKKRDRWGGGGDKSGQGQGASSASAGGSGGSGTLGSGGASVTGGRGGRRRGKGGRNSPIADTTSSQQMTDDLCNMLAAAVGKGIAEASVTSYLIVIALLLTMQKQDKCGKDLAIPVSNVVAALFDCGQHDEGCDDDLGDDVVVVPNLFRHFLTSVAGDDDARKEASSSGDMTPKAAGSPGATGDTQATEAAGSQVSQGDSGIATGMLSQPGALKDSALEDADIQRDGKSFPLLNVESLPKVPPLATYGPFCNAQVWQRLMGSVLATESAPHSHIPTIPVWSVLIALLTVLSASADHALGVDSAPTSSAGAEAGAGADVPFSDFLPVKPNLLTFLLVDFVVDALLSELNGAAASAVSGGIDSSPSSAGGPGVGDPLQTYYIVWSLGAVLNTLRANLLVSIADGVSPVSLGLGLVTGGSAGKDGSDTSAGTAESAISGTEAGFSLSRPPSGSSAPVHVPFVSRLASKVADFIGLPDPAVAGVHNGLVQSALKKIAGSSGAAVCTQYSHFLRVSGIETFVAGISIFLPMQHDRSKLLHHLLETTPTAADCEAFHCKTSTLFLQDGNVSPAADSEAAAGYFKLVLLQKVCIAVTKQDSSWRLNQTLMANSIRATDYASENVTVSVKGAGAAKADIDSVIRSPVSRSPSKGFAPESPGRVEARFSLEHALLKRLGRANIMQDADAWVDAPPKSLFWGELTLLRSIQEAHIQFYASAMRNALYDSPKSAAWIFDARRCSEHIAISDNTRKITHRGDKVWGTILGTVAIQPNSGVHEWIIKLDCCEQKHTFIGIAMAGAPTDSYIGCDENGWGLIGTKALWHKKAKVKADYSAGFGTNSVVTVRFDSTNGTLSYSESGTDFGVAFSDIPKQPIFPAISLFQKNDSVSIQLAERRHPLSLNIRALQSPFILYMQMLCEHTTSLLRIAEASSCSGVQRARIASHPLVGVLLPSAAASFIAGMNELSAERIDKIKETGIYPTMQLLPYLTVVTRKLAYLYELVSASVKPSAGIEYEEGASYLGEPKLIGSIEGHWAFKRSGESNSNGGKEYSAELFYSPETERHDSTTDSDDESLNTDRGHFIEGKGTSPYAASLKIVGSQFGSRIKFSEHRGDGNTNSVEGEVSLCGSFFVGKYTDMKTNKTGTLCGSRKAMTKESFLAMSRISRNILFKSATLCTLACGSFSACLVHGLRTFKLGEFRESSSLSLIGAAGGAEPDVVGLTLGDQLEAADVERDHAEEVNRGAVNLPKENKKWIKSNLLSGGIPLDRKFLDMILNEIRYHASESYSDDFADGPMDSSARTPSLSETFDTESNGYLSWWLSAVFPSILTESEKSTGPSVTPPGSPKSAKGLGSSEVSPSRGVVGSVFKSGVFMKIDGYASHHTGQQMLSKIGGEPMQVARREVLAALVKHSGCMEVCIAENESLNSGKKLDSDRPSAPIMELWRACKKVIELTIKRKQESGASYATVCESLVKKAMFLLELQPSSACLDVHESLSLILESDSVDKWQTESAIAIETDFCKLVSQAVDFLLCPIRDPQWLKTQIATRTLTCLTRAAGFRSVNLILGQNKGQQVAVHNFGAFPAVQSILLQPSALIQLPIAMSVIGKDSADSKPGICHYSDDLQGIDDKALRDIKSAFETVFESATQLLSRCTWANNRDGQCIALSAWENLRVKPEDHAFLNRVGIFRVLQTVLDGARSSIKALSVTSGEDARASFAIQHAKDRSKHLSQLALQVVHSLASQVARTEDTASLSASRDLVPSRSMQRIPSGPDTLSRSLFDMLYNEIFNGMQYMLRQSCAKYVQGGSPTSRPNAAKGTDAQPSDEEKEAERYMFQILRLLFNVTSSKNCLAALSTPKWNTLLLAGVGFGSFGVQRRIIRLLRKILVSLNPASFSAFIPGLFTSCEDILLADAPLDEEDVKALIAAQGSSHPRGQKSHAGTYSCAARLVCALLEGVSAIIPPTHASDERRKSNLLPYLQRTNSASTLSAECLTVLRDLYGVPMWRQTINSVISEAFSAAHLTQDALHADWEEISTNLSHAACLSVIGGHCDSFRVGGMVYIRPFSLVDGNSTLAMKLDSISRCTGMLVSQTPTQVEVIELERGSRFQRNSKTSADNEELNLHNKVIVQTACLNCALPVRVTQLSASNVYPASDSPFFSELAPLDLFGDFMKVLSSNALPWRERLSQNSLGSTSSSRGESAENLEDDSLPDSASTKTGGSGGTIASGPDNVSPKPRNEYVSDQEALNVFTNTSAFRAAAHLLRSSELAGSLVREHSAAIRQMLHLAVSETEFGGLSVLEPLETRWSALWDEYRKVAESQDMAQVDGFGGSGNAGSASGPATATSSAAAPAATANTATSTAATARPAGGGLPNLQRMGDMDAAFGRSGLLEAATALGIFSNLGLGVRHQSTGVDPAAQAAAIAQMVDMGLPPEWCEVALRRCRYNINNAIDMCFEHGDQMAQLVAEDQLQQAAAAQERANATAAAASRPATGGRQRDSRPQQNQPLLRHNSTEGDAGSLGLRRRTAAAGEASVGAGGMGGLSPEMHIRLRLLEDMGFPQSWCMRALMVTGGDMDGALGYILSHGDELSAADSAGGAHASSAVPEEVADEIYNPLMALYGTYNCKPDLTLSSIRGPNGASFPSVGCKYFGASSGKWYYEATLLTNGCMQVGWADSAYDGIPESREQGVGDNSHSWAYDGWRKYLWHEVPTEWGARWAAGDVLGCGIDMDRRVMSFSLNGFTREIGMGEAFPAFECSGAMYPCVSFNDRESLQLNFGAKPFKFAPPPEHKAYSHHVNSVRSVVKRIRKELSGMSCGVEEMKNSSPEDAPEPFDDSFEQKGSDYTWITRYQAPDEVRLQAPKIPSPNLPGVVPSGNRNDILASFVSVSKDLCILYSRVALLRIVESIFDPRRGDGVSFAGSQFIEIMSSTSLQHLRRADDADSSDGEEKVDHSGDTFRWLLRLFKLCCVNTNRTKIYQIVMALLPPEASIPKNLGSLYSIGGSPMLGGLTLAMRNVLASIRSKQKGDVSPPGERLIQALIFQISHETKASVARDDCTAWVTEGIAPMISVENSSDATALDTPSLALAVWSTSLLMQQFAAEISECEYEVGVESSAQDAHCQEIAGFVMQLVEHWSFALRAASVQVKLCACNMLSVLLQSVSASNGSLAMLPPGTAKSLAEIVDYARLRKCAMSRLDQERGSFPVYSEYMQALVELTSVVCNCLNSSEDLHASLGDMSTFKSKTFDRGEKATAELSVDCGEAGFDWEATAGLALSEKGWITLTGSLKQLAIDTPLPKLRAPVDRSNQPPELMIGCRVARSISVVNSEAAAVRADVGVTSSAATPPSMNIPRPAVADAAPGADPFMDALRDMLMQTGGVQPELMLPLTPAMTMGTPSPSAGGSGGAKLVETKTDQIGTVIGLDAWEGDAPGTARLIKWDDVEEPEKVRWNTSDYQFDVAHVVLSAPGKISKRYDNPPPHYASAVASGFGTEMFFGVILRIRKLPRQEDDEEGVVERLVGIIELPDFSAEILIKGYVWADGNWSFTEEALLRGPKDSGWLSRFNSNCWKAGTTYDIARSTSSIDPTDDHVLSLMGNSMYTTSLFGKSVTILSDLHLQSANLFTFDERMKASSLQISADKLSVGRNPTSGGACGVVFGNVGFSSGVHYWEYKIELADMGSIFLGVADKGSMADMSNLRKVIGSGIKNNRTAYRSPTRTSPERAFVYGETFTSGDTVGVLLDMNRGRLSYFLDGRKFGEHSIKFMGDAFRDLTPSDVVKPRTLFPVVGLHSNVDRIVLTQNWMSCIGMRAVDEMDFIDKAWSLLNTWSLERKKSNMPATSHMWIYRDGWRNWSQWKENSYCRIRTRCKPTPVVLNRTMKACVEASIRLGLPNAMFRGDRFLFVRSGGRSLEAKEEAVVLGAYHGRLWYRLDTQQTDLSNELVESAELAWCLSPQDIEDIRFERKIPALPSTASRRPADPHSVLNIPAVIRDIPLSRLPMYKGALLYVSCDQGSVMRNGIEIDAAEEICKIPFGTTVRAVERRKNSSNIVRFKVLYNGAYGWISERMRGETEDLMLQNLPCSAEEERQGAIELLQLAQAIEYSGRVVWEEADNLKDAMTRWSAAVASSGGEIPKEFEDDMSFERYLELATTLDGHKQWSVEADMQLAEVISRCASRDGVIPSNLSPASIRAAVEALDNESSPLFKIDPGRAIARAALMRVANQLIGYALPALSVSLPEEKMGSLGMGSDDNIEIIQHEFALDADKTIAPASDEMRLKPVLEGSISPRSSVISPPVSPGRKKNASGASSRLPASKHLPRSTRELRGTPRYDQVFDPSACEWTPSCGARRLRSLRRLFFTHTKLMLWDSILETTETPINLQHDEWEDPREIKTLNLNRVKATPIKLASIVLPIDRLKQSVMGQMFYKEARGWSNSAFRRSYVGTGHGGQKRCFKVQFLGEGVNDYGGPYRALFDQIVDELQNDQLLVGSKPSERCLLPLLVPSTNRASGVGANQDKFVFSTAVPSSPLTQELCQFFGKLIGTAVRHNLTLAADFSALLWRPLVKSPLSLAHLETVDSLVVKNIKDLVQEALSEEKKAADAGHDISSSSFLKSSLPSWSDLNFSTYLPDGSKVELVPGGEDQAVNMGNWREYVSLLERCRLRESQALFKMFRDGLSAVLPVKLLPMFTSTELEEIVSGNSKVDIALLKQCTEYDDIDQESEVVANFWRVLESFSNEERTSFLRFVWARSRLPTSVQDFPMNFKLQGPTGAAKESASSDGYLPHAQTCFFSLSLPRYSSYEVMREKLLYAINNSPNMDADVRLHSAEGWDT